MPSSVHQLQQSRELLLTYAGEDGKLQQQAFDLLVLALGFAPPQGMQELARGLGVALNDYGFARTDGYRPTHTSRQGVFVAGAFREPKDIPETVAEAAGAAAEVAAFLQVAAQPAAAQGEGGKSRDRFRDVTEEEARVGVFVCECQGGLAGVDLAEVAAWAGRQPGVALAEVVPGGCTEEGQAAIRVAVEQRGLNRVVLAGCSPRLYVAEMEGLMRQVGLDPRLLARVNLREQAVYPHRGNGQPARPEVLTGKAQSLVGMAVAGLRAMAGLEALRVGEPQPLTRHALVVGGGAAGLSAALSLARLEIPVDLVERSGELGGQWRHLRYQPELRPGGGGADPQAALQERLAEVAAEGRIRVHLRAEVKELQGKPGHYRSVLSVDGHEETVEHGVVVVASGGRPATSHEYLYGQDPRVLTQRELEQQLAEGTLARVQTVVMIQCVGSREPERPYCSRLCCTQALKNALKLKELRPEVDVYILYRELRSYGFREAYYQAAREQGVVFLRYDLAGTPGGSRKPEVQAAGSRLRVSLVEPVTGQPLQLTPDLLVLSVGIEPGEQGSLAETLGIGLNGDGFFQEEHAKMKPLDARLAQPGKAGKGGIFLAGLAHSPRFLEETIVQAEGAAMRAAAFLAPQQIGERATSVWVNPRLCSFCGLCVEACPYEARVMNEDSRVAEVDYGLCQGCGVCAMVCPNKATLQKAFEHRQLMSTIDMALV
jgi:heterodisulfide reductase subunit A